MASPNALKALLKALNAEQTRRRRPPVSDQREQFIETLRAIAQRFTALAPRCPLQIDDMSIAELLACRLFVPEHLRPAGLPTEDEIWAEYRAKAG
jgi:hypothetical protein